MATNKNNEGTAIEAITYYQENGENNLSSEGIPQPKQPTDLQGLLRFAMEATKSEDAPHESHVHPLDQEKKRFLEEALKSMTVDVVAILRKQIETLQGIERLKTEDDIEQYVEAFQTIVDYVDNIDIANDFYKIGGLNVLHQCFKCFHPEIRSGACDVMAEICQNNPYCQRMVLNENFIPLLLRTMSSESDSNVCIKLLYALSCIVRHNTDAFQQLLQYEGLSILLKMLQKGNEKLTIKITFLLSSLCGTQADLISRLVFLEFIPVLLTLLAEKRTSSYEHILSLLSLLAEENQAVVSECRDAKYNLQELLQNNLKLIKNKDEFQEEEAYCIRLLDLLFK